MCCANPDDGDHGENYTDAGREHFHGADANGFALDCKDEIQVPTAAVVSTYLDAPIIPILLCFHLLNGVPLHV